MEKIVKAIFKTKNGYIGVPMEESACNALEACENLSDEQKLSILQKIKDADPLDPYTYSDIRNTVLAMEAAGMVSSETAEKLNKYGRVFDEIMSHTIYDESPLFLKRIARMIGRKR